MTLALVGVVGCTNEPDLTGPARATLEIATTDLPEGIVGQDYITTVLARGGDGDYDWSVIDGTLPGGLTLGGSSGAIAGRPTEVGSATFILQVTSGDGQNATRQFTLTIAP